MKKHKIFNNGKLLDIKKYFKVFSAKFFENIINLFILFISFYIFILLYYFFTGINHSTFTNRQIEVFIKKELPLSANFVVDKYLVDLKGYGDNDIVVVIRPKEDLKSTQYTQENWGNKILIFSRIQKNPLEKLIFDGEIYKKDFEFEFKFNSIQEIVKNQDLTDEEKKNIDLYFDDYYLSKNNIHLGEVIPIKKQGAYANKYDLLISGTVFHNGGNNDYYLGVLSYNFGGYNILPLINYGNIDGNGINCYDFEGNEDSEYCAKGVNNKKIESYINGKLYNIELSGIIIQPSFIEYLNNYNNLNIYLHNNECEKNYYGQSNQCSYIVYECYLFNGQYVCNGKNNIIKMGTNKHIEIENKVNNLYDSYYLFN